VGSIVYQKSKRMVSEICKKHHEQFLPIFIVRVCSRGELVLFVALSSRLRPLLFYGLQNKTVAWRGSHIVWLLWFLLHMSLRTRSARSNTRDTQYGDCGCDQLFLWYRAHTCQWRQGAIVNHSIYNTSELPHYTIVS
jgi:hypothetical protein